MLKKIVKKGLFIPGLFATPHSQKFAACQNTLFPLALSIVDFSNIYQSNFSYLDFIDLLETSLRDDKPDFVITYSFGFQLYQHIVAKDRSLELPVAAFIVPTGDYGVSQNGRKILGGDLLPQDVYKPIHELKATTKAPASFFAEIARDTVSHRHTEFKGNLLSISATRDDDADPDIFNHLKTQGVSRRLALVDNHRMTHSMTDVCDVLNSFILSCQG